MWAKAPCNGCWKTLPISLPAPTGRYRVVDAVRQGAERAGLKWRETNYLLLRRGPYVIAAGLDESLAGETNVLHGRFVDLFDPELRVRDSVALAPTSRYFLLDLEAAQPGAPRVLASACKTLPVEEGSDNLSLVVEGVEDTPGIILLYSRSAPSSSLFAGAQITSSRYSAEDHLLWISFQNHAGPHELRLKF